MGDPPTLTDAFTHFTHSRIPPIVHTRCTSSLPLSLVRARFGSAFALFDKDGGGTIDKDELRAVMAECGVMPNSEDEIEQLVDAADTDGDGQISFSEFAAIIRDQLTSAANADPVEERGEGEGEGEEVDGLKALAPLTPADKTRMMLSVTKQLLILLQVRPDWLLGRLGLQELAIALSLYLTHVLVPRANCVPPSGPILHRSAHSSPAQGLIRPWSSAVALVAAHDARAADRGCAARRLGRLPRARWHAEVHLALDDILRGGDCDHDRPAVGGRYLPGARKPARRNSTNITSSLPPCTQTCHTHDLPAHATTSNTHTRHLPSPCTQLIGLTSKMCGCLDSCSTSTSAAVANTYNVFQDDGGTIPPSLLPLIDDPDSPYYHA